MVRVTARPYYSTTVQSTSTTACVPEGREARAVTEHAVPDRLEIHKRNFEAGDSLAQGLQTGKVFLFECVAGGA